MNHTMSNEPEFSNPSPANENADEKEKLLAFSYLFVPLLFLGMKGRERKKT